jgi:hypothetical protein
MVRSFAVKTQERTVPVKVKEITLTIVRHNRNSGETSNCCVCMAFISSVEDTDLHLDPPGWQDPDPFRDQHQSRGLDPNCIRVKVNSRIRIRSQIPSKLYILLKLVLWKGKSLSLCS